MDSYDVLNCGCGGTALQEHNFSLWKCNELIPILVGIAAENELPIIYLCDAFIKSPTLFPDGVHPKEKGARLIAKQILEQLK